MLCIFFLRCSPGLRKEEANQAEAAEVMKKKVSLLDPDALASVSEEEGSNTVNDANSTKKEHNGKFLFVCVHFGVLPSSCVFFAQYLIFFVCALRI